MKLGDLLDVSELSELIKSRHIRMQRHSVAPLAILNYSNECLFEDLWTDTIQKCRGLIIDCVAGHDPCPDCTVVSRPFHKFFNLNHTSQLLYHEVNLPAVVPTVTEKMDGWFGILWKSVYADNENGDTHYGIASRGSFTSPGALFATDKLRKLVKYGAINEFPEGYSAIFEIIFKAGKVVVDYPFEGLVLLGLVNNETGEEMPYDELFKIWAKILTYSVDQKPWIRLVKAHNMTTAECVSSDRKNFEGFVLTYPRPGIYPIKVKVKLDDYKRLHKLITGITPQQIWKELHDPMAKWLEGNIPDHFRKWALEWRDQLYQKFNDEISKSYAWIYQEINAGWRQKSAVEMNKKMLFESLQVELPGNETVVMSLLEGKIYEAHQQIWNRVRPIGRQSETFYREGQGE